MIIFDLGAIQPDFPLAMLQRLVFLQIGIDSETHQALVWSGKQMRELSVQDLLGMIRREKHSVEKGAEGG